jgi:cytochrome P450
MIDASGGEDHMTSDDSGQEAGEETRQPDTIKKSDRGRKLTDEEIVAHAVTFILAGYETTANTLAYTSYLLALNPDIQEKLRSEIDSYFDNNPVS